ALILTISTAGTIESGLKCHREMICKEVLRPGAERKPLAPAFPRITALCSLIDKNRLDGKVVVCLKQQVFYDSQFLSVVKKRSWVIDRCAEVASGSRSVSDRKPVVATFPFQTLVSYAECVSAA